MAIYAGLYNIAADVPHTQPVYWLFDTVRGALDRSPSRGMSSSQMIWMMRTAYREGQGQYAEMCSGCHLAPGMKRTEISRGLYPRAPELRRKTDLTPAEQFLDHQARRENDGDASLGRYPWTTICFGTWWRSSASCQS